MKGTKCIMDQELKEFIEATIRRHKRTVEWIAINSDDQGYLNHEKVFLNWDSYDHAFEQGIDYGEYCLANDIWTRYFAPREDR